MAPGKAGTRLTPQLRQGFHRLLRTWMYPDLRKSKSPKNLWPVVLRMLRRKWGDRERIFDQAERRYGIGHYDDRKKRLEETIGWLEQDEKADIGAVYLALKRARGERARETRKGKTTDFRRLLLRHQTAHRNLWMWAIKARESYLRTVLADNLLGFEALDRLDELVNGPLSVVDAIDRLLVSIQDDPIPQLKIEGPPRRSDAGHQPAPWLPRVRRELIRAGVPEGTEDELLIAVALIPYRPAPSL